MEGEESAYVFASEHRAAKLYYIVAAHSDKGLAVTGEASANEAGVDQHRGSPR